MVDNSIKKLDGIIKDIKYIIDCLEGYKTVIRLNNCNTCGNMDCQWITDPGQPIRFNCPHYKGEEE